MRILDAPPILTVQFKRFHYGFYGGGKINKHVQFGDTLDLAPYMAKTTSKMNKAMQNSGLRYKLYAVLVHTGSSNCGHYYSFVKSAADTWYSMDDSSVGATGASWLTRFCSCSYVCVFRPGFTSEIIYGATAECLCPVLHTA